MKAYNRHDRVRDISSGREGVVAGPEDFDDYDYNKPGDDWQLITWSKPITDQYGNEHDQNWVATKWLEKL